MTLLVLTQIGAIPTRGNARPSSLPTHLGIGDEVEDGGKGKMADLEMNDLSSLD